MTEDRDHSPPRTVNINWYTDVVIEECQRVWSAVQARYLAAVDRPEKPVVDVLDKRVIKDRMKQEQGHFKYTWQVQIAGTQAWIEVKLLVKPDEYTTLIKWRHRTDRYTGKQHIEDLMGQDLESVLDGVFGVQ